MVSQSLSDTQRNIEARESKLAKIVKDITDKRLIRAELSAQIHKEKQNLARIRTTLGQAEEKLARNLDRKQAIKSAIKMAENNDIVLIAGKGHENYQEIKGQKQDFDDLVIAKEFLS